MVLTSKVVLTSPFVNLRVLSIFQIDCWFNTLMSRRVELPQRLPYHSSAIHEKLRFNKPNRTNMNNFFSSLVASREIFKWLRRVFTQLPNFFLEDYVKMISLNFGIFFDCRTCLKLRIKAQRKFLSISISRRTCEEPV